MSKPSVRSSPEIWLKRARLRLARTLEAAQGMGVLARRGPKSPRWRAEIEVVSSSRMRRLNAEFLKKDYTTDVLSFPSGEPFFSQGYLGSIVICLPVLRRQAKERQLTDEMELQVLIAHAVLHLLGFDHEKSRDAAKKMAGKEKALLRATVSEAWIRASRGRCLHGLTGRVLHPR